MNEVKTPVTITKEEIAALETTVFTGRIIVIETTEEAEKAVAYLSTFQVVGFDTETKPSFKKGKSHQVSLIQISTEDTCFLFRINRTGFTDSLRHFLENGEIKKIGLSLRDDFGMLHKTAPFEPKGFVELQHYVKQFNIQDLSLQKIFAILFRLKISKSQRLSNWEADILSDGQKKYAAIDAWACLRIYKKLESEGFTFYTPENKSSIITHTAE